MSPRRSRAAQPRPQPARGRAGRIAARRHRRVPRLHQGHPVHARVPAARRVRVGQLAAAQLAGADRRRRGRSREEGRGRGGRGRGRDDGDRRQGPADPQGRDRADPAADLPRGQLLRRARPRQRGRAEAGGRRHAEDHPNRRAGAARPSADRAAARHARGPQADARRTGKRAQRQADADPGPRLRPRRARRERGAVPERRDPDRSRGAALDCAGLRGAARRRARRRRAAADRRAVAHDRRAGPQRASAAGAGHQLQPHAGRARGRADEPARDGAPAGADIESRQPGARRAERVVPAHARTRPRADPRRARDAGDDRRRLPLDRAGTQAVLARRAARRRTAPGADDARPGGADRPADRVPAEGGPDLALRAGEPAADRRRRDPRRVHQRQGELQGVLLRAGRPHRREPELRRQRVVCALRTGRRRADGVARQRRRSAVRERQPGAARHPPGVPGQAPALPPRRRLPHQPAAGSERPRGGQGPGERPK